MRAARIATAKTYSGGLCKTSTYKGFQCDALQTAELYNETTQTFTLAGTAFGTNLGGKMTTARSGATATLISGSGTALDGKVLITGGSTGSTFLALSAPPAGCGPEVNGQFQQVAQNTAEIYDPATDTFTATGSIPGCAAGTTPPSCVTGLPATCAGPESPITSASESGTTVTITSAANPTGLLVNDNVTISGVSAVGIQRNLHRNRHSERHHVPIHGHLGIGGRDRWICGSRHCPVRVGRFIGATAQ